MPIEGRHHSARRLNQHAPVDNQNLTGREIAAPDEAHDGIGDVFGGRDHSTVIHSIRKVEDAMGEDPEFRREVESVREELRKPV